MTSENTLKVGDIVQLKSGGPEMTIDKYVWNALKGENYPDRVECVWFHGNESKRDVFHTSSLVST